MRGCEELMQRLRSRGVVPLALLTLLAAMAAELRATRLRTVARELTG